MKKRFIPSLLLLAKGTDLNFLPGFMALLLVVFIARCGGGSGGGGEAHHAPVISNLLYSPTSAIGGQGGGTVTVTWTVDFTDAGGDVNTLRITSSGGTDITTPITGISGQTSGTITGIFTVSTLSVGTYTFEVWVIDTKGNSSNKLSGIFTVTSGTAISVLASAPYPSHLVIKNNNLFWSDASNLNNVNKVPVTGGTIIPLAMKMGVPVNLTIYGQDIFWIEEQSGIASSGCVGQGVIRFLNRTSPDGIKTVLAEGDNCAGGTADIVVHDTGVYWVTSVSSPNTYSIKKVSVAGSDSITLVSTSKPIVAMTRDAIHLYWMEQFFPEPGVIKKMPLGGGSTTVVFTSELNPLIGDFTVYGTDIIRPVRLGFLLFHAASLK